MKYLSSKIRGASGKRSGFKGSTVYSSDGNQKRVLDEADREREKPSDVGDIAPRLFDGSDPSDILEDVEDLEASGDESP